MAGLGSRRKMDALIAEGAVAINGQPVTSLGVRVDPSQDRVTVEGRTIGLAERPVYILLNKPKDCITTVSDERGRTTVMDYVKVRQRVFPVGRL
ncbi:MAG: S4 domain-containing protein, partial [Bacteroidota bacterium]